MNADTYFLRQVASALRMLRDGTPPEQFDMQKYIDICETIAKRREEEEERAEQWATALAEIKRNMG